MFHFYHAARDSRIVGSSIDGQEWSIEFHDNRTEESITKILTKDQYVMLLVLVGSGGVFVSLNTYDCYEELNPIMVDENGKELMDGRRPFF